MPRIGRATERRSATPRQIGHPMTATPATMKPSRTDDTGRASNYEASSSETRQTVDLFEKSGKMTWTQRFDRTVDTERNAFGQLLDPRDLPISRFAALVAQRLTSHGADTFAIVLAEQFADNPHLVTSLQRNGWTPSEVAYIVLESQALGLLD